MALSVKSLAKRGRAGARRKTKLDLAHYVAEPATAVAMSAILRAAGTAATRVTAWTRFETVGWDEV